MGTRGRFVGLLALSASVVAVVNTDTRSQEPLRPPAATPAVDVVGAALRVRLSDGTTLEGRALVGAVLTVAIGGRMLRIRIAAVEVDARDPRGEILLYDFRVVTLADEEPLCAPDQDGYRLGLPIAGRSDAAGMLSASDNTFELFCTGAPQAKCVRLGYAPWRQTPDGYSMRYWHNACVRMMRGDYCGDGGHYTRDGTWIDLYDTAGVQKSDDDPMLAFEAGWGADGAVCVARPRLSDLTTLNQLVAACPRLRDRVGEMCTEDKARSLGARLFNRSKP